MKGRIFTLMPTFSRLSTMWVLRRSASGTTAGEEFNGISKPSGNQPRSGGLSFLQIEGARRQVGIIPKV